MDWTAHLGAALAAACATGLLGLFLPRLIARVPEPEPEPEAGPDTGPDTGLDTGLEVGREDAPEETTTAPEPEPGPPKRLYTDIAATPGLAARGALVCGIAGGLVGWALGWSWPLAIWVVLVPLLAALSFIDFATRLLPTFLIRPAYAVVLVGLVLVWVIERDTLDLVRAVLGWLIAGLMFFLLWFLNPRGMGYGDVRLSGVLGLALGQLGWGQLFVGLYSGFLLFGLPGLLVAVFRRDRSLLKAAYPFGPFMILGALVGILFGAPLWSGLVGG